MARNRALVYTNCKEGKDAEFNKWYDEVHAPEVIEFSKVTGCQRFRLAEKQHMGGSDYSYLAIYEFDCAPDEAIESLMKAQDRFDMSDTLTEASMAIYEPLSARIGTE